MKEPEWWIRQKTNLSEYLDNYDLAADSLYNKSLINRKLGVNYTRGLTIDSTSHTMHGFFTWRNVSANKDKDEPDVILAHLLKEFNPRVKAIVIVRNPTNRLFSQYKMKHAKQNEIRRQSGTNHPQMFHNMAVDVVKRMTTCINEHSERYCAYTFQKDHLSLKAGMYSTFIKDWIKVLGENLMVIRAEQYYENRGKVIQQISAFLDISPLGEKDIQAIDESGLNGRRPMKDHMLSKTRTLLDEFYAPFNRELTDLLKDRKLPGQ